MRFAEPLAAAGGTTTENCLLSAQARSRLTSSFVTNTELPKESERSVSRLQTAVLRYQELSPIKVRFGRKCAAAKKARIGVDDGAATGCKLKSNSIGGRRFDMKGSRTVLLYRSLNVPAFEALKFNHNKRVFYEPVTEVSLFNKATADPRPRDCRRDFVDGPTLALCPAPLNT